MWWVTNILRFKPGVNHELKFDLPAVWCETALAWQHFWGPVVFLGRGGEAVEALDVVGELGIVELPETVGAEGVGGDGQPNDRRGQVGGGFQDIGLPGGTAQIQGNAAGVSPLPSGRPSYGQRWDTMGGYGRQWVFE